MEEADELLIKKYIQKDEELRKYVEDHEKLEADLEGFNKRIYLTAEEEVEKKNLQKRKLRGKEQIFRILARYRNVAFQDSK
ncbi:MAG: DUF465 domain-containing protein [Deltaproteobacteria bacterium]|jgi:uncharacterized protein YdcH (DUF465 family)|nr:DUF465 domain-containing protein [Deltaproteobacteria bacterium]